jgi:hypothetical protein
MDVLQGVPAGEGAVVMELTRTDVRDLVAQGDIADRARTYAAQAKSINTRRAYQSDWRDFTAWCKTQRFTSLPATPATVALYLTDLAERVKASTLTRQLVSMNHMH